MSASYPARTVLRSSPNYSALAMSLNKIPVLLAVINLLFANVMLNVIPGEACAGENPAQSSITPAQAKRTLSILQDDERRAELEETLGAIARATGNAPGSNASVEPSAPAPPSEATQKATQPAPVAPPAVVPEAAPIDLAEGGLVAQVFDLIGERLDTVVNQLRSAVRTLLEVRTVGGWWQYNLGVPERRTVVLEALLEVVLILAGALFVEWVLRRALSRPRRIVEDRATARQTAIDRQKDGVEGPKERKEIIEVEAKPAEQATQNVVGATDKPALKPGSGARKAPAADRHL